MVTLRRSANVDVGTPATFFAGVSRLFGPFDLDVCCNPPLTMPLAPRFYTPADDGLTQPWAGRVWCNPPYDNEGAWILKAATERAYSVLLVPAKTSVGWWQIVIRRAAILLFVRGRLRFEGMQWDAAFANCIVVFDPERNGPPILGQIGKTGELL